MLAGMWIIFFFLLECCHIFFSIRLLGLCLLQNELCPIFLNRHVLKYILGRMIRFHDLAFFDPVVYESLRQLVVDAEGKDGPQVLSTFDLTFSIDLGPEEGGGSLELVSGGRDITVTVNNVYDYVRKYAQYRMIKTQEKALDVSFHCAYNCCQSCSKSYFRHCELVYTKYFLVVPWMASLPKICDCS